MREDIRGMIAGIDELVELEDGRKRPAINFDNASTTPALLPVMKAVNDSLLMYGSVGRGFSQKSDYTTEVFEKCRRSILRFLNADVNEYCCVFVNNTTDGINKLASALITDRDDVVLLTRMEHHSNDLPWRERCRVLYAEVDSPGRIRYDEIERLLKNNSVRFVSVSAASNVTGYVTDVHRIAGIAHRYGAKIIVDGAQIAAHRPFSMLGKTEEENIDFFVFSAHKMYAPFGGGAVVALKDELELSMPRVFGGGSVTIVSDKSQYYEKPPRSYEAGSPNFAGAVALAKSIGILSEIGMDLVQEHDLLLNRRLIDGLQQLGPEVTKIDTKHIGVTGCSYAGKMALYCGAFDERVALTIAQEPGGGGAAAWRASYPEDEVENLDKTDYHWFLESQLTNFGGDKVYRLPYDQHELCAMICPRALLLLGNPDFKWLADDAMLVSAQAAKKVWERFGIADRMGWSIVGGHGHCQLPESQWPEVQAFIDRFLLGRDTNTNDIRVYSK